MVPLVNELEQLQEAPTAAICMEKLRQWLKEPENSAEELLRLAHWLASMPFVDALVDLLLHQLAAAPAHHFSNQKALELLQKLLIQTTTNPPHEANQNQMRPLVTAFRVAVQTLSQQQVPRAVWNQLTVQCIDLVLKCDPTQRENQKVVVEMAGWLLQLHQRQSVCQLNGPQEVPAENLPVLTLVWKNVTRLVSTFPSLFDSQTQVQQDDTSSNHEPPGTPTTDSMGIFTSLQQCLDDCLRRFLLQQPQQGQEERVSQPKDVEALQLTGILLQSRVKVMRFLFRAFQKQFHCFVQQWNNEMHERVACQLCNLSGGLLEFLSKTGLQATSTPVTNELDNEVTQFLEEILGFAASTKSGSQLADHVKLQTENASDQESRSATRGAARFLVWLAFRRNPVLAGKAQPTAQSALDKCSQLDSMLSHFRRICIRLDSFRLISLVSNETSESLIGILLTLSKQEDLSAFQVHMLWTVWREMLFHSDADHATGLLRFLLSMATCEDPGFDHTVVVNLIAFLYPTLLLPLQRWCLDQVQLVIDGICQEGPKQQTFSLQRARQLDLLEKLVQVGLLDGFELADQTRTSPKHRFASKYLPMAFDCLGAVLDLIKQQSHGLLQDHEWNGFMRVADACLLVLRGILGEVTNETTRGEDPPSNELASLVLPLCIELLKQLSQRKPLSRRRRTRIGAGDGNEHRILESCFALLRTYATLLRHNNKNNCVVVLALVDELLNPADHLFSSDQENTAMRIADFVCDALSGVQVVEEDVDVVWSLFERLFRRLTRMGDEMVSQWKPLGSVWCLAFYKFLAQSNVSTMEGKNVQSLLSTPSSVKIFTTFLESQQKKQQNDRLQSDTLTLQRQTALINCERQFLMKTKGDHPVANEVNSPNKRPHEQIDGNHMREPKRQCIDRLLACCQDISSKSDRLSTSQWHDLDQLLQQLELVRESVA